MLRSPEVLRLSILGGTATALTYVAGVVLGVVVGNAVSDTLPGHMSEPARTTLAALTAIGGLVLGSAFWGVWMGRLGNSRETRRMVWTGILGLVPITVALGAGLIALESAAAGSSVVGQLPVHRVFTVLFVPTAFVVAATACITLGVGLRNRTLARSSWWQAGLGASLLFLVGNLVMELSGWRIGAPGAAERFTMLTVLFVSAAGASLAGGGVIGYVLARSRKTQPIT